MQKVMTYLWFDTEAEEAARFYTSIFENSKITHVQRYGDAGPGPAGSAMTVDFELDGQRFIALNGGPHFRFTEAISLYIDCADQSEVDFFWSRLTAGGEPGQCGWLKDRYGLSWQVIPRDLPELLGDADPEKASRAMQAMLSMTKIDVEVLRKAHQGG